MTCSTCTCTSMYVQIILIFSIYSCTISHTTISIHSFKATDQLKVIFDEEGWYLDTVTLKSGLEEFPYEEVFGAVSNYLRRLYTVYISSSQSECHK